MIQTLLCGREVDEKDRVASRGRGGKLGICRRHPRHHGCNLRPSGVQSLLLPILAYSSFLPTLRNSTNITRF